MKGRPETEETIPIAKLRGSIGKAAYQYTEKHIGPKDIVGNKAGSLANRLRTIISG